ncbi:hypothetical protein [Sphingosinicella terrae]|uniref:hypothetical protein n=1 Tax=Sphingosinicella terrae TaxID=2172047 RepID=UPI000E0DF48E|nr:hypothetical protein [Sphingosinicella terrae]
MMKSSLMLAGAAVSAMAVAAATAVAQPAGTGATANYWMSAETASGFAAQAQAAQGGRSGMLGALMSGRGQSQSYVHNLNLQLASPRRAAGEPSAEHLPPTSLGAGPSLPLVTPQGAPPRDPRQPVPGIADGQARGRILIYWGCGERARAGQPFEIDLARLSRGDVPAAMSGVNFRMMTPPSASGAGTYGEWPNARSRTTVPAGGSLVGDHVVRGNYAPEMRFSLAQGQDFLPPIVLTSNSPAASGAVPVAWRPVTGALGYFLMASGAREDGTIVMWSSSEVQAQQMAFDYLAPEETARLVQQRVLLAPQTTQCTIPAEVASSVQAASLMMNAFGPEANFSHPARPARAPRGWAPEWTMKLRTRSTHMGMLGMDMEAMMSGRDTREAPEPPAERRRRRSLNPLQRILGQ